jgi:hypothetical protein
MTSPAYTAKQGRRFALTLAIAFAVLAALSYWRGRELPPLILSVLAMIALLSALIIPSKLEAAEAGWMKLAHAISRITTPIFMGIVYFVILTPIGLLRRLAGGNPLVHRSVNDSYWIRRTEAEPASRRMRMERQF